MDILSNKHRLRSIIVFSSLALIANFSVSVNASDEQKIIVTASRIQAPVNEVPASISVIQKDEIEQLSPNKLSDLLRYEPGVNVEKTGGRFGDANINIRGIGGNRILVIKDGTIMPDGFGSRGASQGRGNFDPFNLQQVEILKGPASAIYGSNALGGVVVIKSANPEYLINQNQGKNLISLNTGYFSEDNRYRLGASAATQLGEDSYALFQVQGQKFEETDINSDFVPNPKEGESENLLVKWQYQGLQDHFFEVVADYFNESTSHILNTNLRPISGPPGSRIVESTADDDSKLWRISFKHEIFKLAFADKFSWQIDHQYSNFEQFETERTQSPNSTIPPIRARDFLVNEWEDFEQKQAAASFQFEKEFDNHRLVFGAEYINKSIERPIYKQRYDAIGDTTTDVINGYQYPGKTFPDAEITQYGVFLQDYIELSESFNLIAGIRYDHFENKPQTDQAYENFNVSGAVPENYSDSAVSPHLGAVWELSEQTSLFANYSTGFRSPPVAEQYISRAILIPVPGVPHEVIPNNELSSEESRGVELGLRWFNPSASFEVSVYKNKYDGFIDSKSIGYRNLPPLFVGPTAIRQIQYQNVDEVEIKGVEFSGKKLIDSWLPKGWKGNLHSALSIIDGENVITGSGLNSIPSDSVILGLNLEPAESLQFNWHISHSTKGDDVEPLNFRGRVLPAFEPPSYTIQDISFRYKPIENLALSLSVYNLTDKKYWSSHNKGANASGNLDARVAPGRNFAFSLSYKF